MTGFSDEFRKWWKSDTGVDPGLGLPVESDPSYPPKEMTDAFEAFQGGEASRLGKEMIAYVQGHRDGSQVSGRGLDARAAARRVLQSLWDRAYEAGRSGEDLETLALSSVETEALIGVGTPSDAKGLAESEATAAAPTGMGRYSMSVVETAMRIHGAMTGSGDPIGEDEREALVGWLRWRIEVAWEPTIEQLTRERDEARANLAFASRMWDSPITSDWFDGVRNEAAHQVARWGTEHDAGKAPADWFGLLEYLGGKALHAATLGDVEKALHHTISAGACLMNWHRHLMDGQGLLRPGIEPPTGDIG